MAGNSGHDTVAGNSGHDTVAGNSGHNTVAGNSGHNSEAQTTSSEPLSAYSPSNFLYCSIKLNMGDHTNQIMMKKYQIFYDLSLVGPPKSS